MFLKVSWIAVTIIVLFCVYTYAQDVSLVCLGCLCDVSTGCNISIGCNSYMVCGPFSITKYYWDDVGKPPPMIESSSEDDAFRNCVNDLYCAGYAVQAYMAKHSKRQLKDCNGDGVIDCDDYVRLHRLGSAACNNSLSRDYEKKYKRCLLTFNPIP